MFWLISIQFLCYYNRIWQLGELQKEPHLAHDSEDQEMEKHHMAPGGASLVHDKMTKVIIQ